MRQVAWPTRAEMINYTAVVFTTLVLMISLIFVLNYVFGQADPPAVHEVTRDHVTDTTDTTDTADPGPPPGRPPPTPPLGEAPADDARRAGLRRGRRGGRGRRRRRLRGRVRRRGGRGGGAVHPQPLRPPRPLVRGPHLLGLREQGQLEPEERGRLPGHGGPGLRGRHPHGGRGRVQERQEGHRPEEGLPRLPPGPLRPRRRHLGGHPQHPGGHRVRGPGHQAHPAVPARGREHPAGQGRRASRRRPSGAGPASSTRWTRRSG